MNIKIIARKFSTLLRLLYCRMLFPFYKCNGTANVMSIEKTLRKVIDEKLSVTRFGDSEYLYMIGGSDGLQKSDLKLQEKLKEAICNREPHLLVCMVDYLDQKNKNTQARLSMSQFYVRTYKKVKPYINSQYKYGNSNMTRFYMGAVDKSYCDKYFELCKQIWNESDIVIFEGVKTRFGVGNDLFVNSKSIRRVLCPSKQAFDHYEKILDKAKEFDKSCLLIFALGVTATIAASDLTNEGYRVIDIGNLDVEYEWFNLRVTKKIALKGKQVSEVAGGTKVEEVKDIEYLSQIVGKVGVD